MMVEYLKTEAIVQNTTKLNRQRVVGMSNGADYCQVIKHFAV